MDGANAEQTSTMPPGSNIGPNNARNRAKKARKRASEKAKKEAKQAEKDAKEAIAAVTEVVSDLPKAGVVATQTDFYNSLADSKAAGKDAADNDVPPEVVENREPEDLTEQEKKEGGRLIDTVRKIKLTRINPKLLVALAKAISEGSVEMLKANLEKYVMKFSYEKERLTNWKKSYPLIEKTMPRRDGSEHTIKVRDLPKKPLKNGRLVIDYPEYYTKKLHYKKMVKLYNEAIGMVDSASDPGVMRTITQGIADINNTSLQIRSVVEKHAPIAVNNDDLQVKEIQEIDSYGKDEDYVFNRTDYDKPMQGPKLFASLLHANKLSKTGEMNFGQDRTVRAGRRAVNLEKPAWMARLGM